MLYIGIFTVDNFFSDISIFLIIFLLLKKMKTNKKFPFLKYFSQEEIKRYLNGWITKSEIAKHVLQDISSNDDDDNLINKTILIKPNIWGPDFMNHKYWKEHTYHPSLNNKNKNTM